MRTINDNPIHRQLSKVEREFRTARKVVPPTEMLMLVMDDYLKEHHPNIYLPVYKFSDNPVSIGFDDDGDMMARFSANPRLPHTDMRTALKFCPCGETPILISSISDEESLRLILSVISHDCGHGYTVPPQAEKPASKKRRKRDARKQAA